MKMIQLGGEIYCVDFTKGGAGSGNYGHSGRVGEVGGSGGRMMGGGGFDRQSIIRRMKEMLPREEIPDGAKWLEPEVIEDFEDAGVMNAHFRVTHEMDAVLNNQPVASTSSFVDGKVLKDGSLRFQTLHVDESLRGQGLATDLTMLAVSHMPKGVSATTSGVFSAGGRGVFDGLVAKGLATITPEGNYLIENKG
jgi:hypothetical protein